MRLYAALSGVAQRIGLDTRRYDPVQVEQVAAYVSDLVGKRSLPPFDTFSKELFGKRAETKDADYVFLRKG